MLGYFNNEQANKETFDKDGWLRSGDIGFYDKDGFLFLVDRIKELIKVKGMQVILSMNQQIFILNFSEVYSCLGSTS